MLRRLIWVLGFLTLASIASTAFAQTAPSITTPPQAQSAASGGTAIFTVVASGNPAPAYQWLYFGSPISGATSATLTLANVTLGSTGEYSVAVTNSAGSVTSTPVLLTIDTLPNITAQPTNAFVTPGQSWTFTATAFSNPAPSFQWQKNGVNIPGATSSALVNGAYTSTFTLSSAQVSDGANYTVVVTNGAAGSVTSNVAVLTIDATITTQPQPQTVANGGTATFTVAAVGSPAPTYQWLASGTPIAGATSPTLILTDVQFFQVNTYSVVVTNPGGSVTSSPVSLSIETIPNITAQPAAATVLPGQSATFTAIAFAMPAPTFQWQKNGVNIPGATSSAFVNGSYTSTFTIPNAQVSDGGSYTVVVTNGGEAGSILSNAATLTVETTPAITTQPSAQVLVAGQSATFAVAATGTPAPSYQWTKNGAAIPGATSATFTIPAVSPTDAGTYAVVVTNSLGSVTSGTASLGVNTPPAITTQPVNSAVALGQLAIFTVVATGNPAVSYQWRFDGTTIAGATGATLSLSNVQSSSVGTYTVVVTNSVGSAISGNATLSINVSAAIAIQPASEALNAGQSASFSVVATDTPAPTYQWTKNGTPIAGATSPSLTLTNVQPADAGIYAVVVANAGGSATSSPASLTVFGGPGAPAITAQPVSQTVASNSTVIFTVSTNGSVQASSAVANPGRSAQAAAPTTYQWQLNEMPIAGATSARLVVADATSANAGVYTCLVTNSGSSSLSNPATLTVAATANAGRLINLSVLSPAGNNQVLTVGFVTGGAGASGAQTLLIRATGPSLAAISGLSGTLADPTLSVLDGSTVVAADDNWGGTAAGQTAVTLADLATGAFALANPASLDSALVTSLATNSAYTVQIGGNGPGLGTTLAEVYDDTPAASPPPGAPRLINLSSNNLIVAHGSMTAGFVIGGATSKTVLIRATGPALALLGVPGTMPDPQLALHTTINSLDTVLVANAGWGGDPQIVAEGNSVGAFPLTNPASADSVVLATLAPGAYTAIASSVSGAAGVVLIEIYEVP